MNKKVYIEMKKIQNNHWWFAARKEIIMDVFSRYCKHKKKDNRILDAGCGMGVMLETLSKYGDVYGMDMSEISVNYCGQKWGRNKILQGTLPDDLPFENDFFDNILALDLLEHIEDDKEAVKALYSMLKPKGNLLITVPAFKTLWGYNDVVVKHYRRYVKKELIDMCHKAGFKIKMCSYYNFWFFIPIWIVRKLKKLFKINKDDMGKTREFGFLNKLCYNVFVSEKKHLRKKGFPFGVSIIMVAVKK
ncbi:MAG: class I SAM-dependent methyltransferase [Clostridium sp.]|nr:class I SAM-dependent methyltransferase [Clostridium sp.]